MLDSCQEKSLRFQVIFAIRQLMDWAREQITVSEYVQLQRLAKVHLVHLYMAECELSLLVVSE